MPGPLDLRPLHVVHSSYQPLAVRALSSWEYPVVGPLSTDPTEPVANPVGHTHLCCWGLPGGC